jgi:hypothetical protein
MNVNSFPAGAVTIFGVHRGRSSPAYYPHIDKSGYMLKTLTTNKNVHRVAFALLPFFINSTLRL